MRVRFGPFTIDRDTRQLTRDTREIHLTAKALELLLTLVERRPQVQSKATLQETLWPDTFVTEANLSNLVGEIRRALGDKGRTSRWIRTVHGFGYAFSGEVNDDSVGDDVDRPLCCLRWGRRRFTLSAGEHIIGRDPEADVRLDMSTVSRRHARLIVTPHGTVLEDFGSKNGTRRGRDQVTTPVQLADGDEIRIGALLLTFHARPLVLTTDTHAETAS